MATNLTTTTTTTKATRSGTAASLSSRRKQSHNEHHPYTNPSSFHDVSTSRSTATTTLTSSTASSSAISATAGGGVGGGYSVKNTGKSILYPRKLSDDVDTNDDDNLEEEEEERAYHDNDEFIGSRSRNHNNEDVIDNDIHEDYQPLMKNTSISGGGGGGGSKGGTIRKNRMTALEIESNSGGGDHIDNQHHHHHDSTDEHIGGRAPQGSSTSAQMVVNIVISFVGAGLLGQPHAFQESGWCLGGMALFTVSALNVYSMLRLPAVQLALYERHGIWYTSYSELGRAILGPHGESLVIACLGISQAGFATAYIIFIAANIYSIGHIPRWIVCTACTPGLIGLVQFRDLQALSPFSLVANAANLLALTAVLIQDYESYEFGDHNDVIHAFRWNGLLYVVAITIYSMEGVGLILSLKASYRYPRYFDTMLMMTLGVISTFMVLFGVAGYWAFGDATQAPVTLNLTSAKSAIFCKLALCVGLYLTYPIMMFPIWNIVESSSSSSSNSDAHGYTSTSQHHIDDDDFNDEDHDDVDTHNSRTQNDGLGLTLSSPSPSAATTSATATTTIARKVPMKTRDRILYRSGTVLISVCVAYGMPHFGTFLSLVGSSICTLLGFVFPTYFHLKVMNHNNSGSGSNDGNNNNNNNTRLPLWQRILDTSIFVGGIIFGILGTIQSIQAMLRGESME